MSDRAPDAGNPETGNPESGNPESGNPETGGFRAGFVSFVGRPNAGKSTLTNALVGQKVAITSSKPQTTRRAIRGVVHVPGGERLPGGEILPGGQLVIVDTPGMHRPRTLLGQRLNDVVQATLAEVDVIALCIPADEKLGPGDRFINEQLDRFPKARKVAVVTKTDAASRPQVAAQLLAVSALREWDEIIPVSALTDVQLDVLTRQLLALMPPSPPLYPDDAVTDESLEARMAELIREAALEGVSEELPHSIAVTIDDVVEPGEGQRLLEVYANIWVERESQKGIVIGKGGARLQQVGATARAGIEELAGRPIYLSLRVKVAKQWQRDPKQLGRLGF